MVGIGRAKQAADKASKTPVKVQSSLEIEIVEKLASIGGMKKMLEEMRTVNEMQTKIIDGETELAKIENWNQALSLQLEEVKFELFEA